MFSKSPQKSTNLSVLTELLAIGMGIDENISDSQF